MLNKIQFFENGDSISAAILRPFINHIADTHGLIFESSINPGQDIPLEVNLVDESGDILFTGWFHLPGYYEEEVTLLLDKKE